MEKELSISDNRFLNLMTFLFCITNEGCSVLLHLDPDYIIDKFSSYIQDPSEIKNTLHWNGGLHPKLTQVLILYLKRWGLERIVDQYNLDNNGVSLRDFAYQELKNLDALDDI